MDELRSVSSPRENVAETQVVSVQDAQTRIKQIIVQGYYQNLPKAEVERQIAEVIARCGESFPESTRDAVERSLAISAQKWHYTYGESVRAVNYTFLQAALVDEGISVKAKTYSIDVAKLAGMNAGTSTQLVEKIRPLLTEDKFGMPLIEDYQNKIRTQIRSLASDPAYITRIDRNGNPYTPNLRNFAEMKTRYEANLEDVARLKDGGVKLVWTSSHPDASPRCYPYQGRLYSLDGTSGVQDGISYTPLEDALLGPKGDGNGIINGYNCRHRLIEYHPGTKAPKEYDEETIRKENAVNNRQRSYERDIRLYKTQEALARSAGDDQGAARLQDRWKSTMKDYVQFSVNNGRAYYPWRAAVTEDEINRAR